MIGYLLLQLVYSVLEVLNKCPNHGELAVIFMLIHRIAGP